MNKIFSILFIVVFLNSCSNPKLIRDELVYDNDFENNSLESIDGGGIFNYNGDNVIGNFNNDGFDLHLNDLGPHDYVFVSFDLYIHGSWDGNFNGFKKDIHGYSDKPDLWVMELRPGMGGFQNEDFQKFETTFSNSVCVAGYCLRQSYPNSYPFENNPKSGYWAKDLKENCLSVGWNNVKTTMYKVEKGFNNRGNALVIRFYDNLYQPNAIDSNGNSLEKCDESWSIDNLKIRVIGYD